MMRTRKEKIEFLNGLMTGERKLNELRPVKNFWFYQNETNPDLFKNKDTAETITRAQLDELEKNNPNSIIIIYVIPGTPPQPGAVHLDFSLAS